MNQMRALYVFTNNDPVLLVDVGGPADDLDPPTAGARSWLDNP
jgi:hypothetical protein